MYVLIVGAGKVGWNLARELINKRHEVTVVESDAHRYAVVEQELEHSAMYGDGSELWVLERGQAAGWEERGGRFTEGTALEIDALLAAGIDQADAFVASTDGDNTNLVIAQIARRRFNVERVVVRVLDPARARWYAEQGLQTVCPTQTAIELLEAAVRGQIRFEGVSG